MIEITYLTRKPLLAQKTEYPRVVAIETTSHCNAKCVFCPNSELGRPKTHMNEGLFLKILRQCQEFVPEWIEPFFHGEPFMDPRIIERIWMIRQALPSTKIKLYTNAFSMAPEKIERMVGLAIDEMIISLNSPDPEKYRAIMGLAHNRTLDNIAYLARAGKRGEIARRITLRMTRSADVSNEDELAFLRICRLYKAAAFICGRFNYKGDIEATLPVPAYPCEHLDRVNILADGKVALCCMDQNGEYSLGDVNDNSILEIYNGEKAGSYRAAMRNGERREIEPCNECNLFWPGLKGLGLGQQIRFGIEFLEYYLRNRPYPIIVGNRLIL